MRDGFVYIDEALPGVRVDAKYAGYDNFMGRPAAGYEADRAACTLEAALALKAVYEKAEKLGLGLIVFDAYRPARAVADFCRWVEDTWDICRKALHYPNVDKSELIKQGYIAARSGHSRGSTIDLTLCRADGTPLDMGGIFDLMDPVSHHGCPYITPEQTRSRETLRALMLESGFTDYENEWWHYRLADEPYPDTYFDFVIKWEQDISLP